MKYSEYKLNNGLRILLVPNKNISIINFNLSIKIGNDIETKKTLEISHFLEHLMTVYTSKKYPCGTVNRKFFSDNNISEEAETDNKLVVFRLEFQNKYIETVCDYVINSLLDFTIDNNLFKNELNSVVEELNEIINDTNYDFESYINTILYKNHCRSISQKERLKNIKNIKESEVLDFHNKYVNSKNMIISFIGNFDKDKLLKILKRLDKPSFSKKQIVYKSTKINIPKRVYYFKNSKDVCNLRIIFRCNVNFFDDIYYQIYALIYILTNDLDSLMLKKLRAIEGLIYYISGDMDLDEQNNELSNITFSTSVDNSNLVNVIKNIMIIIDSIKKDFIETNYIQKYKQFLLIKKQKHTFQKNPEEILNEYSIYSLWNKKILTQEQEYKEFNNISKKSLKDTANKIFDFKNMIIFYDGNKNYNNLINKII